MEHHCHCLACFCAQHDFWPIDLDIVGCGIRCELALNQLCQRYSVPSTGAQQLVCCCHRANAPVESRYEIGHRSIPNRSLGNNGADGSEGVLDTMVELRDQCALVFLCALALSHVDVDAYHPFRMPFFIVGDRTASFDPTDLAGWEVYAVLTDVLLPLVGKSLLTRPFRPFKILSVHSRPPLIV